MSFSYHRSAGKDESDDDSNVLDPTRDLNSSSIRIPLIQVRPRQQATVPPRSTSPIPYSDPPLSRYTLSESYVSPSQSSATNLGSGRELSPPGRPVSVMSNITDDPAHDLNSSSTR